jgi:hypothetical protein
MSEQAFGTTMLTISDKLWDQLDNAEKVYEVIEKLDKQFAGALRNIQGSFYVDIARMKLEDCKGMNDNIFKMTTL